MEVVGAGRRGADDDIVLGAKHTTSVDLDVGEKAFAQMRDAGAASIDEGVAKAAALDVHRAASAKNTRSDELAVTDVCGARIRKDRVLKLCAGGVDLAQPNEGGA